MRRSIRATLAAIALTTVSMATSASEPPGDVPLPVHNCQRQCLEGYVNSYLEAMRDKKVDPALFAKNARFTENGVELPLGNEGLWYDTVAIGNYKYYIPDPETQQVTFLGTVMEQAPTTAEGPANPPAPVGIALRLRIDDQGKISEVEQIVARPDRPLRPSPTPTVSSNPFPATGEAVEKMGSPDPVFLQPIPPDQRESRADLIAVANAYFDAIQRNTGKGYYPFTDDCLRHENGMISAGPPGTVGLSGRPVQTCKGQFETSLKGVVTTIRDRRYVAVDRERGIVFVFGAFPNPPINWTWEMGELFKIEKNQIRRIEAIFIRGPYGVCSGWSTYEQCRSEEIHDVR
jgi:hypothetical protein